MKTDTFPSKHRTPIALLCAILGGSLGLLATRTSGQSTEPPPTPPTGDVVAAPEAAVPAPEDNYAYFHDQLSPYGQWVDVQGYGPCWYPNQAIAENSDWRPYYDMGHWVNTENGLFWVSDYPWGEIPFHYGRWVKTAEYPWLWVPDYTWGPAWVFWRHDVTGGMVGWAPLPFGAVWVNGGFEFQGRRITDLNFDFGLGENAFVFVSHDHFMDARFVRTPGHTADFEVARDKAHTAYGRSVPRNDFGKDANGRIVNGGAVRGRVEQATGRKVETKNFEERRPAVVSARAEPAARAGEPARVASPVIRQAPAAGKVFRPAAVARPAAPAQQAAKPEERNKRE
jgi:hypothetical protein